MVAVYSGIDYSELSKCDYSEAVAAVRTAQKALLKQHVLLAARHHKVRLIGCFEVLIGCLDEMLLAARHYKGRRKGRRRREKREE